MRVTDREPRLSTGADLAARSSGDGGWQSAKRVYERLGALRPPHQEPAFHLVVSEARIEERAVQLARGVTTSPPSFHRVQALGELFVERMDPGALSLVLERYYRPTWDSLSADLARMRSHARYETYACLIEGGYGEPLQGARSLLQAGFYETAVVSHQVSGPPPLFVSRPIPVFRGAVVADGITSQSVQMGHLFGQTSEVMRTEPLRYSTGVKQVSQAAKVVVLRLINGVELLRQSIAFATEWDFRPQLKGYLPRFKGPVPEMFTGLALGAVLCLLVNHLEKRDVFL